MITYASTGQTEEVLASFVFPDRARLDFKMKTPTGIEIHRTLALYGDRILQRRSKVSSVEGANRPLARMTFEAKRALFAWPLGFEWRATKDNEREALVHELDCCKGEPIGRLVVVLDDEGRPLSIQGHRGSRALEKLGVEGWGERRGRPYPERIVVSAAGKKIMEEAVTEFRVNQRFLDKFFRLDETGAAAGRPLRVIEQPMLEMTYRREKLKKKSTWKKALESVPKIRERYVEKLASKGLELDPLPTFELDSTGAPVALLLRLKKAVDDPPRGWTTVGVRPGYFLLLSDLESVGAFQIGLLTRAVPRDRHPGAPMLRILPESSTARYALMVATDTGG
ncbi:MAG: hypothetical protein CMJ89_19145 [Planctomycetes bacterium]|jgi:hypothetical protein|nr:hypothetical protein [Planctomycetota bacterium]